MESSRIFKEFIEMVFKRFYVVHVHFLEFGGKLTEQVTSALLPFGSFWACLRLQLLEKT